jgi:DMSO/TMAO reductase YedYZ molybdopterin-dependent catalytic subunit
MTLSRRDVIRVSGTAIAGLSLGTLPRTRLVARQSAPQQPWPDELVEMPVRERSVLPLNPDGSAPEYSPMDAGPIDGVLWRYTQGQTPEGDYDYRDLRVRVDPRGMARVGGTMRFEDLEPLPRHSAVYLLQCGAPAPRGIAKWTGVRFRDVAELLGLQASAHYARFVGTDRYYVDEEIRTLMHPQVMLAWLLNDEPIPPEHGAPLRLIIPFRYGARWLKAVTEMQFGSPGLPSEPLPS